MVKGVGTTNQATNTKQTNSGFNLGQAALIVGAGLIIPVIAIEVFQVIKEKFWDRKASLPEDQLITQIKDRFGTEIGEIAEKTNICFRTLILHNLSSATDQEAKMVKDLMEKYDVDLNARMQILFGAHVRLEDNGESYKTWESDKIGQQRISSHPATGAQYGIQGPFVKELLYGQVAYDANDKVVKDETKGVKKYTWFQLERNSTKLGNVLRHTLDFIQYRLTGKNQGPWGASAHTDKNPLILKKKQPKSAAAAA